MGGRHDSSRHGITRSTQIFKKTPFVEGIDALDQVYKLSRFLGTDDMMVYCSSHSE
jgi:hypothetical protein